MYVTKFLIYLFYLSNNAIVPEIVTITYVHSIIPNLLSDNRHESLCQNGRQ